MLGFKAQMVVRVLHALPARKMLATAVSLVAIQNTSRMKEQQSVWHVDPTVFHQRIARSVSVMLDIHALMFSVLAKILHQDRGVRQVTVRRS